MVDTGVYTITWLEEETSKNITWADDAANMTEAQRLAKIKEHCHFAVVQWDGSKPAVNYWLYDEDLNYKATDETGKTSSGQSSVLTGADGDVMMLYETVWWKVTTSGSGTSRRITISFTWDESNTDSTWVSPHTYGDNTSSTSIAQYVGMGVFEALNQNSQMRSVYASSKPTGSVTQNNFYNAAIYGRNWQYNNMLPMTYAWYIIQLYFVKGNLDCQTAYGNGICGASSVQPLNTSWSATSPWINGTTANQTSGVTALGIHNPWGNQYRFMGEMRYDNKVFKYSVLGGKDHYNIESGSASTWKSTTVSNTISGSNITAINGVNEYPFFPNTGSGITWSQNYADYAYTTTSTELVAIVGGFCNFGLRCGPLCVVASYATSYSYSNLGARLHVIITPPPPITTLQQLTDLCINGGEGTLGANISGVSVTIPSGKTVTLNMEQYTLSGSGNIITANGELTIRGGTIIGGGGKSAVRIKTPDGWKEAKVVSVKTTDGWKSV